MGSSPTPRLPLESEVPVRWVTTSPDRPERQPSCPFSMDRLLKEEFRSYQYWPSPTSLHDFNYSSSMLISFTTILLLDHHEFAVLLFLPCLIQKIVSTEKKYWAFLNSTFSVGKLKLALWIERRIDYRISSTRANIKKDNYQRPFPRMCV